MAAAQVRVHGHEMVLVWCRFDVAAGTLSVAAGRRFVAALDWAVTHRLPVVAIANSGGARMQEGSRGFLQMVEATKAVRRLRDAGLWLAVYLAHPTTGGVFASWASLGHVTYAEPGAMIGFTGPRVAAALGEPIEPASTQSAEGLHANGLVDAVVAVADLRDRVAGLAATFAEPAPGHDGTTPAEAVDGPRGWAAVEASRQSGRLRLLDEVVLRSESVVELAGDRCGGPSPNVFIGWCRLGGRPVLVLAHRSGCRPGAADLAAGRRAMLAAQELGTPVVSIIDTAGAAVSGQEEARGLAGEIARSIDAMAALTVPSVAVVAGEGTGGAAMAWLAADKVIAASDSWVAPIAPAAASLIVHRDTEHDSELADVQEVGAVELRAQGIVDAVFEQADLVDALVATLDDPGARSNQSSVAGHV